MQNQTQTNTLNTQRTEREKRRDEQAQKTLSTLRTKSEEEHALARAMEYRLPYMDLYLMPVSADDVVELSLENSQRFSMGIFIKRGRNVRIGVTNPDVPGLREFLGELYEQKGWEIELYVISQTSLEKLQNLYGKGTLLDRIDAMKITLSREDLQKFEEKFGDIVKLRDRMRELPTSDLIALIFSGAIKMKASDIHFEVNEADVRMRYRLDGVLHDIGAFPLHAYTLIVSRIKMMAKMKLNVRTRAQDGHFALSADKEKGSGRIDIRVSIIPSRYGESIVMRLLRQDSVLLGVEDLGLRGRAYERLQQAINKTNGMVLTTGPTGSGKTTTLYAVINKLNDPETKIITIENPIEYEIAGISQTEVIEGGYTFSDGLRAIVRQDPDVVLVGEIRDDETAGIAVNAALTGHLVLSTVHTNSAIDTVPRLIELGVKTSLIGPSINVAIAQRLVRRLCKHCKEEYVPAKSTAEMLQKILAVISPKAEVPVPQKIETLWRAKGCEKCNDIGYSGQIGIFEVLEMSDEIQRLVGDMRPRGELLKTAVEEGMVAMEQDGILKAIGGETTIEEVWRVAGTADFLKDLYEDLMQQTLGRALLLPKDVKDDVAQNAASKESFSQKSTEVPVEKLLPFLFAGAMLFEAGDIHIEPEKDSFAVRFRIDGILQTMANLPRTEYPGLLGEIKVLSGMKAQVVAGASDGRFSVQTEGVEESTGENSTDVRVSILMGGYGETVVLRLLNTSAVALDLKTLGIRQQNLEKITRQIARPNGFFCNTGPTGSGKTTTLYSILKVLNAPEIKIMTVEDPIEYRLDGILQTQVNTAEGYTFGNALRTLLRQNPDIIMIGEIRDDETAQIAAQAALTGHFVLSTLHTNNAIGSIQRLLNVGVSPDNLAELANGFMAQRLIRTLCSCKRETVPSDEDKKRIEDVLKTVSPNAGVVVAPVEKVCAPVGCEKCRGIGYKGRCVISEILVIDADIQELIAHRALSGEIEKKAIEKGMITMTQDGALKIMEGVTTLEEVSRVTEF